MRNIDFNQLVTPATAAKTEQARLLSLLSEHRWASENEGVFVTKTSRFQSDRTTRAEMTSLLSNLELGTIYGPITWKSMSGWEAIGIDQLRQILWLLNAHVQACFTAERNVEERIIAGDIKKASDLRDEFSKAYKRAIH